jgi:hypothetical protein
VSDEVQILIVGAMLVAGVLASLLAGRVRVPALVSGAALPASLRLRSLPLDSRTLGTLFLAPLPLRGAAEPLPDEPFPDEPCPPRRPPPHRGQPGPVMQRNRSGGVTGGYRGLNR